MIRVFCRSLDRPVNIFGLRGRWITVFIALAVLSVVLGLTTGAFMGSGVGVSVAILGAVASFLGCYMSQVKTSHRDLEKLSMPSKCRTYVRRQETLCRIILDREENASWFMKNSK